VHQLSPSEKNIALSHDSHGTLQSDQIVTADY
jgi:hypothetical protein